MITSMVVLSPIPSGGRLITQMECNIFRARHSSCQPNPNGSWSVTPGKAGEEKVDLVWRQSNGEGATWTFDIEPIGIPNFDAKDTDYLLYFYRRHLGGKNTAALFSFGGKGTRKAANDLAHYAYNKMIAIDLHREARPEVAQQYEEICDRIYNSLPSFARW